MIIVWLHNRVKHNCISERAFYFRVSFISLVDTFVHIRCAIESCTMVPPIRPSVNISDIFAPPREGINPPLSCQATPIPPPLTHGIFFCFEMFERLRKFTPSKYFSILSQFQIPRNSPRELALKTIKISPYCCLVVDSKALQWSVDSMLYYLQTVIQWHLIVVIDTSLFLVIM